ncbi:MAG: efflux RND transporter permease subunit [Acidimicrobiales bacterium]
MGERRRVLESFHGPIVKHQRTLVVLALLVVLGGVAQLRHAKVDALPEFVPPRVEVQTEALGLSAQEVEQLLTVPLERTFLNGIPFLKTIRSSSVPGLSSIQLTFEPGTDLFTARQLVQERLSLTAELPNVSRPPQMLQAVSSASRVMMIGLSTRELTPIQLSVLSQFTLRPRLLGVPGVADVAIFGAREQQLQVQVDPARLAAQGVSLDQVITTAGNALFVSPLTFLEASTPGSGGFFDTTNQRLGVQHILPIRTPDDLSKVAVADAATPLKIADVATVVEDHQPLIGDAALNDGPALLLVVTKLPGANTREVTRAVDDELQLLRPGLKGIEVDSSVYRPAGFIDQAVDRLRGAAIVGVLLALAALALLLRSWRPVVVAATTLPVSLIAAASVLALRGQTFDSIVVAGLVAAVALVVFDVIATTTALRDEAASGGDPATTGRVLGEVGRSLAVGTVVVGLALAPVLFLEGLPSKSFLPSAALSYALAVGASLVVALAVAPAVAALVLPSAAGPVGPGTPRAARGDSRYGSSLASALRRPALLAVAPAVALLALGGLAVTGLHGDLQPTFSETDLVVHWEAQPGTSLTEMGRVMSRAAAEVRAVKGVRAVGTHVGRAVGADQVVGSGSGEMWVSVSPHADHQTTRAEVQTIVNGYPGLDRRVLTYFTDRVREAQGEAGSSLVVRLYGEDTAVLRAKGAEIRNLMAGVKGVKNARVGAQPVQPTIQVEVDLAAAEKQGIKPGDIRRGATTLVSGLTVGSLYEDQKVFQVVVVGAPGLRHDLSAIQDLSIDTPSGGRLRLGDVARITVGPGLSSIEHDQVSRSLDVRAQVEGGDAGAATREVEALLKGVKLPPEHDARVINERQGSADAGRRLVLAGLLVAGLSYLVFQAALGSWRLALLPLAAVPVALAGGLVGARIGGRTFSLGSLFGLVAVGGFAVRGALLLLQRFRRLQGDAPDLSDLAVVRRGTAEAGVPSAVAALVAAAGLVPFLAIGRAGGGEVVRPLTFVVLGGLVACTLLALLVLPAAYLAIGPTSASPARVTVDEGHAPAPAPAPAPEAEAQAAGEAGVETDPAIAETPTPLPPPDVPPGADPPLDEPAGEPAEAAPPADHTPASTPEAPAAPSEASTPGEDDTDARP